MSALELLLIAALVFASACLSASEIALFSLSRFQLRYFREHARAIHRKIRKLLSDPGGLLITILVLNEVLNISISTMITRGVALAIPISDWGLRAMIGTLISAPLLLVFCEVTPKAIAVRANRLIAPLIIDTITFIYGIFKPVRLVLKRVVALVGRPDSHRLDDTLKESDFLLMLEEGHKEGAVQSSELELIKNVFDFDDTKVADVFTPLPQVLSLPMTSTIKEALAAIRTQRFSRIPVTGANKGEVIGILYSKDLLRAKLEGNLETPITELMLRPVFVAPTLKLNSLFRLFKQHSTHMAVVQKPPSQKPAGLRTAGDTLGIITMSDVLDTLFEDIFPDDEPDEGEHVEGFE